MAVETEVRNFRLISGVFNPDEANEILMTLIDDKISFHRRNNWSRNERFGDSGAAGARRISELRDTKTELATLMQEAGSAGQRLAISCTIEITLLED